MKNIDYTNEKLKDEALLEIKSFCLNYLRTGNIDNVSDEQLIICYKIVINEHIQMTDFKKNLKIKTYSSPFYEIYSNLDTMISKNHLLEKEEKVLFLELTKDVNHLIESLSFCYGILYKIINERNLDIN